MPLLWHDAEDLKAQKFKKYAPKVARLADWLETNILEGLAFFSLPDLHLVEQSVVF